MIEWSETEVAIRDAIREFVDNEIRPHADALDSGEMLPYPIIRKFFSTFGIDALALENFKKSIEAERDREAADVKARGLDRPGQPCGS